MVTAAKSRSVAVVGATGLVGRRLVQRLCADPGVTRVYAIARRALEVADPKLVALPVDFSALPELPAVDEIYLALGTTIKVAGSQAAFQAIDLDANLAVARAAHAAGARRIGLVSAMGANADSRVFYNRVKGQLEQALAQLDLDALVIARPSLLRGDRAALGQAVRRGEVWGDRVDRVLRPLIPRAWRAIAAADVAAALAHAVPRAQGQCVLSSGAMQGASRSRDG
jgi:uncharacterized protein YbjT (DUF2867 family)